MAFAVPEVSGEVDHPDTEKAILTPSARVTVTNPPNGPVPLTILGLAPDIVLGE